MRWGLTSGTHMYSSKTCFSCWRSCLPRDACVIPEVRRSDSAAHFAVTARLLHKCCLMLSSPEPMPSMATNSAMRTTVLWMLFSDSCCFAICSATGLV